MPWWATGKWLDRVAVRFKPDQLPENYRHIFDSPSGEIVLADLARECDLLATAQGAPSEQVMFSAGKRHVITYILAQLGMLPQQIQQVRHMETLEEDNDA